MVRPSWPGALWRGGPSSSPEPGPFQALDPGIPSLVSRKPNVGPPEELKALDPEGPWPTGGPWSGGFLAAGFGGVWPRRPLARRPLAGGRSLEGALALARGRLFGAQNHKIEQPLTTPGPGIQPPGVRGPPGGGGPANPEPKTLNRS